MSRRASTKSLRKVDGCRWTLLAVALEMALCSAVAAQASSSPECVDKGYNPLKNVYFGDLHSHTAYSFDAVSLGTRTTPNDAYRFAKGEAIALPPYNQNGEPSRSHQLKRPLDFLAVTDHSEYFGEVRSCFICEDPSSKECSNNSLACQALRGTVESLTEWDSDGGIAFALWGLGLINPQPKRPPVCDGALGCQPYTVSVWEDIQEAAHEAYQPCEFTSFVAYEWTGVPTGANWHRNVIFRNENVPGLPVSYFDTGPAFNWEGWPLSPKKLWQNLERYCIDSTPGCDVLSVPHNPNLSVGGLFPQSYTSEEAEYQNRFERLAEIHQTKGNSECRWGIGTTDELCQFELVSRNDLRGWKPASGPTNYNDPSQSPLSAEDQGFSATTQTGETYNYFLREALKAGLFVGEGLGVNPYKLGFVGGTDTHISTPGAVEESNYKGHHGVEDDTIRKRMSKPLNEPVDPTHNRLEDNPGGLTVVWAEENTRDSIFDSLRAKETYATSGIRPTVRFFGGWAYPEQLYSQGANFAQAGYDGGVPMGSDLGTRPEIAGAPRFAVMATKDPDSDAKLQRIQVVKGWLDADGELHERVYDVASTAAPEADTTWPGEEEYVDLKTCSPVQKAPGADALCTVWVDPSFDASQSAFYYARVLANPTCRWSTRQCLEIGGPNNSCWERLRTPSCSSGSAESGECPSQYLGVTTGYTIQERAWTSPIWYEPGS